ncbi:MAG TPA: hypothetical protein O0X27_05970, partial [Methanocorpusculum sp.]|nr:hypothetical protein [Methanocorpusculum sp.]
MKSFNKKIITIAILALCIVGIGFVGAAGADGLTLTADPTTVNTGETVTFSFAYDGNYTYAATAVDSDGKSVSVSTSEPTSGSFTQTFDTAGTYTVTVEGTNKTSSSDKKSGSKTVTVTAPKTSINSVTLTLTAPETGKTPAGTATVSGTDGVQSATVAWDPTDNPFKAGTTYKATITLTAKANYQFADSTAVTLNGDSETKTPNTGKS